MINLPIGVDDFSKVGSFYYVDKSLLIRDILDYCQYRIILFAKPRRFGKSLNLSMVVHFFTNRGNNPALFSGLSISSCGQEYLRHQGAYPVVHINFKDIDAARSAYDALTEDQQALVGNVETLTSAESASPPIAIRRVRIRRLVPPPFSTR